MGNFISRWLPPFREIRGKIPLSQMPSLTSLEPRLLFTYPLSSVPVLNSHPDASRPLYLDFNGTPAESWGLVSVPATPAFNQDGDPSSFSDSELASIRDIFARVAEKYAPFDLNVTTVDPLTWVDDENPSSARIVIGGNGDWWGNGVAGIAYVGGLYNPQPNTGYVFSQDLGNLNKPVAETVAHEAGHLFGLEHQSVYSGTTRTIEYNPGNAEKAPIMGNSRTSARGLWWNGPNAISSTTLQDDLAVLEAVLGYRQDDHANTSATATALSVVNLFATRAGIIERASDSDVFSFTAQAGQVSFTATPGSHVLAQSGSTSGAMLDLKLELRNSAGTTIASADTTSLGETLAANIPAGTYYLVVASHGLYGDIGTYNITGTLPAADLTPPRVSSSSYDYQTGPQKLTLVFSENVQPSLTLASLRLLNTTSASLVDPAMMSLSYDTATNTATLTFPGLSGILPDGNYTLTVLGSSVTDSAGNQLDGAGTGQGGSDHTLSFFVLAGDANRDRIVNFFDLTALAANYGTTGRTWADGDFNGDGQVNFFDLTTLSANYGKPLPAPSEPVFAAAIEEPVTASFSISAPTPLSATLTSDPTQTPQTPPAPADVSTAAPVSSPAPLLRARGVRTRPPAKKVVPPVIHAILAVPPSLPMAVKRTAPFYKGLFAAGQPIKPLAPLKRSGFRR